MKLKWIFIGLATLVVAVVVAGFAILSSLDFEEYRGTIQDLAKEATGRDLVLAGPIDVRISLTPAITVEDVTFGNAPWGSRPELMTLKRFEIESSLVPLLSGRVEVQRLVLVEPDVLVETNAEGESNLAFETTAGAVEPDDQKSEQVFDLALSVNKIAVEGGRMTYRDGASGAQHVIALDSVEVLADGPATPIGLAAAGSYNEVAFSADGTLGSFEQLQTGPFPFEITAQAAGAEVGLEGSVASPTTGQGIALSVSAKGAQIGDLGALAGASVPALGAYDVAMKLAQEGEALRLDDIAVKLGESDIAGSATLSLAGERPAVEGAFTASLIDLAGLTPATGESAGGGAGAGGQADDGRLIPDDPLPLEALRMADAALTFKAEKLRLPNGLELAAVDGKLTLQAGKLEVSPFSAGISGGKLNATVALDAAVETPTFATRSSVKGLDYGRLLKEMQIEDGVVGSLDADLDLRGQGGSPRAIAASLTGHSEVLSNQGVLDNDLLTIASAGLGDVLGPLFGDENNVKLNCMVSRFAFDKGLATSQAMIVDTDAFTVSGAGTVDLRAEQLDLAFDTESRKTSLTSLAVPFNVTGTLASPTVAPDPLGTALGVAKTAGMVINPVAGLAVLIGDRLAGEISGDENPCLVALGEVKQSGAPAAKPGVVEGAAEGAAGAVEDAVEGVTEGLKSLFGD